MTRHLILVGLPGAGKTTVGRRAAEMLAADFSDLDEMVESETGRSIPAIFQESGEAEFRRLERAAMDRALAQPPHLIAAGAGWIAQPGNLDTALAAGAAIIYLKISVERALARVGADRNRPLLVGGDRAARLRELLREREGWYGRAHHEVPAEGDVETVAARLVELAGPATPSAG